MVARSRSDGLRRPFRFHGKFAFMAHENSGPFSVAGDSLLGGCLKRIQRNRPKTTITQHRFDGLFQEPTNLTRIRPRLHTGGLDGSDRHPPLTAKTTFSV